ncbi:MAG: BMP family ABC transporter substrate-binding protein, partial [Lachnospiraceae bacterium]|nr:BMP family ABC transporter substrate-binding protein [Lachnospiraceae bacterium]
MSEKKRRYLAAFLAAVVTILLFLGGYLIQKSQTGGKDRIKIGFVFDGDGATPYTANFIRARDAVNLEYEKRVEIEEKNNVPYTEAEQVLEQLVKDGCDLIFTNSFGYGEIAKKVAKNHPEVQFCQATCNNANEAPVYENYHTFMGEIYEGRYIAGKVAGLKLNEMIASGEITEEEAVVGYVGAYPYAEVISGYTAFFLGVRSECSFARMRVRYTNAWTAYSLEKEMAEKMIEEGCVIISQHSDTIGPAVACENAETDHPVYHVGYNQDMIDVAPTTSLIGTRIDWSPYILAAVKAVLEGKRIEDVAEGHIHGNDAGAGFEKGWVQMLELNRVIAAEGSEQVIESTIRAFRKGRCEVFQGDYI